MIIIPKRGFGRLLVISSGLMLTVWVEQGLISISG
jgi:hypothetical protein